MFSQLVLNGLIAGSIYALVALGFVLIYSTTRFFHFAHGIIFTAGAYITFLLLVRLNVTLVISIPVALAASALLGCLVDVALYRPLRKRNASGLILLLVSLGTYIALQNTVSMIFGDDAKRIGGEQVEKGIALLGARITTVQLITIAVSVFLVVAVSCALNRTNLGKSIRAVANDNELAVVRGIDSDRIILGVFAIGSFLAGTAGVLLALDVGMTPTMGMRALMMGIVAVIIGGVDNPVGAALGALLLGLAQHLGVFKLGSEWQDAIAFLILTAFLLFRPQGIFGKRLTRKAV